MIAVADALGKVQDAGDKISLAKGLFGKAGEGLVPLFNDGADAIRAATRDMELYGHAINGMDAEKVGTMNDQIGRLKLAWEGVTMQLAVHFAPLVSDVSGRLLDLIEDAGGVGKAVDKAFGAAVTFTGEALNAAEDLHISWLKFKRTLSGIMIILNDIGNFGMKPVENIVNLFKGDETEKRLQGIAPDKRAEFERLLKEAGGFESEKFDLGGGLRAENEDIQKQIAEAEKRKSENKQLGDRFIAFEQQAQAKGAANAAAKLGEITEKRLGTEEAVSKELKKQTAEKKEQKRLESGGQGKFSLMAFNGAGTRGAKSSRRAEAPTTLKAIEPAISMQAATAGGTVAPPKRAVAVDDPSQPRYLSKIPDGKKDYLDHIPTGKPNYLSKIPGEKPKYLEKMGDSMTGAIQGDPVTKALTKNQEQQDRVIALLEKIAGNTKGVTVGALA